MKKFLIWSLFLLVTSMADAQNYVQWHFSFDDEASAFVAEAKIEEGWHLYSQELTNEFGPIPTEFSFKENQNLQLVGKTTEPEPIKEYDPNFDGELNFFKENARFVQEITIEETTVLKGTVTYMVCNDEMCMPPIDVEFEINVENEE